MNEDSSEGLLSPLYMIFPRHFSRPFLTIAEGPDWGKSLFSTAEFKVTEDPDQNSIH